MAKAAANITYNNVGSGWHLIWIEDQQYNRQLNLFRVVMIFRMLAQSYTPNIYTPPLYCNYFIILSPLFFTTVSISGVFRGAIGPWPPLWPKNFFFDIGKNLENLVWPPFCVSTSGQRTFGPPYEILNTPLVSIPICSEPRIHPPVEWEYRETKKQSCHDITSCGKR